MASTRRILTALAATAALSLWLLLAGPDDVLGIDPGHLGTMLLMATAWGALYAIQRMPTGLGEAASPAEWRSWTGAVFSAVAVGYFLLHLDAFAGGATWTDPAARHVARNLVLLLVAWTVLGNLLASRSGDSVEQDERDREIAGRAASWGRGATTVAVLVLAGTIAFSPPDRLQWATHFMIANLLVLAVMLGTWSECTATAVQYWRDRR
jgi:hypothetical protein